MEVTWAVVVRVHADAELRGHLGLAPVVEWESEIQAILRMAEATGEDALLEAWVPTGFATGTALAKIRSSHLTALLRNSHRRGVLSDTPKEEACKFETLWLGKRACNYTEALECLRAFVGHTGLLLRRQRDKAELLYAIRVDVHKLREAQAALHFDVRERFVA
eukprot:2657240-Amphidinium_carterae.4